MLDVLAFEEGRVRQHHRRIGVRLERPAQHRVILERLLWQLAARQVQQQLRAEVAMLRTIGVGDEVLRQLARRGCGVFPFWLEFRYRAHFSETFRSSSYSAFTAGLAERSCVPTVFSSAISFDCSAGGSLRSWPPLARQSLFALSMSALAKVNASLSILAPASSIAA